MKKKATIKPATADQILKALGITKKQAALTLARLQAAQRSPSARGSPRAAKTPRSEAARA